MLKLLSLPPRGRKVKKIWPGNIPGHKAVSQLSARDQLQPLVAPHVSHFSHVPLRTIVKFWHSLHMLPV
jgi:hypothetical protein